MGKPALYLSLPSYKRLRRSAERARRKSAGNSIAYRQLKSSARRQKPIRRITAKKAKSDRIYNAMVKAWLKEPGNEFCRVEQQLSGAPHPATCNHHLRGRHRTLKFDKRFWCPTAWQNNLWPHENPAAARRLGLLAERGEWNREPNDTETERIKQWMVEQGIW